MQKLSHQIAIDLVVEEFKLEEPYDIQERVEKEFNMEIHIDTIIDYIGYKFNYVKTLII